MAVQIQLRRDTAANFTSGNPVLAQGEMAVETDTLRYKLGDGVTAWTGLQYGVFDGFTSGRRYQFDDTTTDADPGAGKVRFNHATFGSITHLYFDNADYPGGDASAWLDALDDSSNPNAKGTLFLQKHEEPGTYREFIVMGAVVDGTGYRKVPVTPLSSNGALADNDQLVVAFYRAGDAGTIETDGGKSALVDADAFIIKDSEDGGAAKDASVEDVRASLLGPVIIDDDTMASASSDTVSTSGSTKTYVDGKVAADLARARMDDRRNRIINPCMQISQQNGNTAGTSNGYFPADQWTVSFSTDGAVSAQRVQSITPAFATDRLRVSVTSADASLGSSQFLAIGQKLEGSRMADACFGVSYKTDLVVRFGFKGPAGTYAVALQNAAQNRSYVAEFTIAGGQANTDTVHEISIPGDTTGTWPATDVAGMNLWITLAAGSGLQTTNATWGAGAYLGTSSVSNGLASNSNVFELFDVGLRLDPEGTGAYGLFEVPEASQVLRDCQRYFVTVDRHVGTTRSAGDLYVGNLVMPVPMRVTPTLLSGTYTVFSGSAGTMAIGSTSVFYSDNQSVSIYNSASNWTVPVTVRATAQLSARM